MKALLRQLKALWPTMLAMYLPILFALGLVVLARVLTGIHISYFTADPAQTMKAPFYVGILSNVGILLWCAAAAICYFASWALSKAGADRELRLYLLSSGILTSILLFDDFFQGHERIYPTYLHVPEAAVIAGYVVLIVWLMARFRKTVLRTEFLLLALAYGSFGLSIIFDLSSHETPGHFLLEDGAKLAGIVTWFTYFTRVSSGAIRARLGPPGQPAD